LAKAEPVIEAFHERYITSSQPDRFQITPAQYLARNALGEWESGTRQRLRPDRGVGLGRTQP
jgi:hypothetical protein